MAVKKILNTDVSKVVDEMLSGYVSAYKKYYTRVGDYNAVKYRGRRPRRKCQSHFAGGLRPQNNLC